MVHEIFHTMYEGKEVRFFWIIYIATDTCGKVLKITVCLHSDMHETTNPVIDGTPM